MLQDCSNKVQHISDDDWSEICARYGLEFNPDTIRKGSQPPLVGSVFVSEYYKWKESQNDSSHDDKYLKELENQKRELQKERVKVRDERNELNRVIREEARKESYKEQVIRNILEYQSSPLLYDESKQFTGVLKTDNDLIISCTDIHAGIEIDNYFNKFDENVLKDRFNQYLDKIFEVQSRHGSENVYVILSELVSGIIHNELRIENNQNLIEQFLSVTNYISQFLAELSYHFNTVNVYICPGNHSRISPKKEDSLKGENIDHLAIPFLEAKLQNFDNIKFYKNEIEESIAMFTVRNNIVMSSHGDKDSPNNVVQKFTLLFGIRPSLVYLGHRHKNGLTTVYNTKVIESGTLSGTDNYALDLRLHTKPSQTISVVTKDGLDCLYDVKFN
uniref:DNA polymerase II small subunit n=1 Tax=Siphoviridae sp. ctXZx16 TaxID=2826371 RepID=A0A8S5MKG0_9CAUD|nr:MAG TPA: DNA polymerase II small subunit [Siphoviridae sp. ctXZx16]